MWMDSPPRHIGWLVLRPPTSYTSAPLCNEKKLAIFISLTHGCFFRSSNSIHYSARTYKASERKKARCVILADGANTLHAHTHQVNLASYPLQIIVCVQDYKSSQGRRRRRRGKYKEPTSNDMLFCVYDELITHTNSTTEKYWISTLCKCGARAMLSFLLLFYFPLISFIYVCMYTPATSFSVGTWAHTSFFFPIAWAQTHLLAKHIKSLFNKTNSKKKRDEKKNKWMEKN